MEDSFDEMFLNNYCISIKRQDGSPVSMPEVHRVFKTLRLSFDDYQQLAFDFAAYPSCGVLSEANDYVAPLNVSAGYIYPALGLCGEAGEVAEKIKKIIRDENGIISEAKKEELSKEIGDVLWYCAALCTELKLNLRHVAQANLDKLSSRKKRGTLHGEGDNR